MSLPHRALLRLSRLPAFTAWAVLALGLALTVAAWALVRYQVHHRAEATFDRQAEAIRSQVANRLLDYHQLLRGAAAFIAAHGTPSEANWREYVARLRVDRYYPGLIAVGYAEAVDGEAVIRLLEPANARNRALMGRDLMADAVRREALDRAAATGEPAMTPALPLITAPGDVETRQGVLAFLPAYRGETLVGYVLAPVRIDHFLRNVLGEPTLTVRVYDGLHPDPARLLYASGEPARAPLFESALSVPAGGQQWTLTVASTPAFERGIDRSKPVIVLLGGTCASLLLFGVVASATGARRRAVILAEEITEELRESEERFKLAVVASHDGIWDWNLRGNEIWFSPRWKEQLGYADDELPNRLESWTERVMPADQDKLRQLFDDARAGTLNSFESVLRVRHKDGGVVHLLVRGVIQRDAAGQPIRLVGAQEDITRAKALETELTRLATTDPLTALLNRRQFLELARQELRRAERSGRPFSLLLIDVDHFKQINDRYGHAGGDAALLHLAQLINASLRESDLAARLGGEEFVLLLPETDLAGARLVADRLRQNVADQVLLEAGQAIRFTISAGLAQWAPGERAEDCLQRADEALYAAKRAGRNRVEVAQAS